MVSKIWDGMSTTNIHLLQFKLQSHMQKQQQQQQQQQQQRKNKKHTHTQKKNRLWMQVHQNSYQRKKKSEISNITFTILPFSH